jgi:TM2 domain-containing membrane protein YozV
MNTTPQTTAPNSSSFKNKTFATLLAALGGTFGLHRFYLRGSTGWRPWLYVMFCFTLIPTYAGFLEAIIFALTPDEKWDAQWNATSGQQNDSGWIVIITAGLTLLFSVGLLMALMAIGLSAYLGANEL